MARILIIILILASLIGGGVYLYVNRPDPALETKFIQNIRQTLDSDESTIQVELVEPGESALLNNPTHVYQTFNNCGPATLSMIMAWWGVNASQAELADIIRPYRNQAGDNDDKNTFTYEFVQTAEQYGLKGIGRANGDIELLKRFTANGIPVVVKTLLHQNEDIGHFRLVRGFDESEQVIIQDDSYEGKNKKFSYWDYLSLWQPFNYEYMIIYTPETQDKVMAILGEERDEGAAWKNALSRAEKERSKDPESVFPIFNVVTASFHTGDFQRTVRTFEEIESRLPKRMLWYQIEPILAYQRLGNYDRVFEIIERILTGGNKAFSELYMIRGEIYLERGERDKARQEFEQALFYNKNLKAAQEALENL